LRLSAPKSKRRDHRVAAFFIVSIFAAFVSRRRSRRRAARGLDRPFRNHRSDSPNPRAEKGDGDTVENRADSKRRRRLRIGRQIQRAVKQAQHEKGWRDAAPHDYARHGSSTRQERRDQTRDQVETHDQKYPCEVLKILSAKSPPVKQTADRSGRKGHDRAGNQEPYRQRWTAGE
jgi:hypothetical protein